MRARIAAKAVPLPERLDDYVAEDSTVRVVDVFVDDLNLSGLSFRTMVKSTGRPGYHPATLLKLFVLSHTHGRLLPSATQLASQYLLTMLTMFRGELFNNVKRELTNYRPTCRRLRSYPARSDFQGPKDPQELKVSRNRQGQ